jgi:hypothetical protein
MKYNIYQFLGLSEQVVRWAGLDYAMVHLNHLVAEPPSSYTTGRK